MAKRFIGVREVDEETFNKFRARAVEKRLKLGMALTLAMQKWLEERRKIGKKEKIKFPKLKPFDFGPGTEKLSTEIDKILYGEE